jgi:hypothetical protein
MTSKGLEPVVCSECGLPWAGACVCLVIIILMCGECVVVRASCGNMRATTNYPLFHRQKDMLSYWLMQSRLAYMDGEVLDLL